MAIQAQQTQRVFLYAGLELADTDPTAPVQRVLETWAAVYPELTTASVEGPEVRGERVTYTFVRAVRDKGSSGPEARTISQRIMAVRNGDLNALDSKAKPIPSQTRDRVEATGALVALLQGREDEVAGSARRLGLARRVNMCLPLLP